MFLAGMFLYPYLEEVLGADPGDPLHTRRGVLPLNYGPSFPIHCEHRRVGQGWVELV